MKKYKCLPVSLFFLLTLTEMAVSQERQTVFGKFTFTNSWQENTRLLSLKVFRTEGTGKIIFSDSVRLPPFPSPLFQANIQENFADAVASGEKNTLSPLQRYEVAVSPAGKYFLVYRYELNPLAVQGFVLNDSGEKIRNFSVPVGEESILQHLYVDDQIKIFMLSKGLDGEIQMVRFDPATGEETYLEVAGSALKRRSLQAFLTPEGAVYAGALCETEQTNGILYARLDFRLKKVQILVYHEFSDTNLKKSSSEKDILDIESFSVNRLGEIEFVLEKHRILANNYNYDPYRTFEAARWKPRLQKVVRGEKWQIHFYIQGKLVREEKL
jgi:hypothetical protein